MTNGAGLFMMLGGTVFALVMLGGLAHWLYCSYKDRHLYEEGR